MPNRKFRIFATADIGDATFHRLRQRGYEVEIYPSPEPPPKSLIIEKVRGGIDGLITTLRDPIDAEIFEAGQDTLKAVAQYAVGFDNINRADANRYKIPFTNTADVLTEATAEFAFFALAALARKLWTAEHLVRENQWGYWHPSLPFLGDEMTGKTIAIIGTGRIGQAVIKKCIGFDMNILCYEAMGPNDKLVAAVQEEMDLRHQHGLQRERTSIKYVSMDEALSQSDFISIHYQGDEIFVKELILQKHVMVVHGSGFGQRPGTQHFRIVFLPDEATLTKAYAAIADLIGERYGR